jgi:hypothetical protein
LYYFFFVHCNCFLDKAFFLVGAVGTDAFFALTAANNFLDLALYTGISGLDNALCCTVSGVNEYGDITLDFNLNGLYTSHQFCDTYSFILDKFLAKFCSLDHHFLPHNTFSHHSILSIAS